MVEAIIESQISEPLPQTTTSRDKTRFLKSRVQSIAKGSVLALSVGTRLALCPGDDITAAALVVTQTADTSAKHVALPSDSTWKKEGVIWEEEKEV